ncbi:MAG: TraM recognition domain-containing protein, partial [Bacteroidota bacterium]
QTLLQPNIFWVLTGNDLPLRINDKNRPMLLCIGNYPPAKAAYSPLIALIITLCFKAMYGHGKVKSFVAIDELPTLFLPDLSELPATARKYGIATIACLQSNAQLAHTYEQVGAQKIQQTLVNKFIGNTEDASAVYGSELVGKKEKTLEANSQSTSVQATSYRTTYGKSFSTQERALLAPQDFMRFEPGEFAGKVAEGCPPFFHTRLKAVATYDRAFQNARLKDLPTLQAVEEEAVMANYQRVWKEVKAILASYKQDAG